MPELSIVQQITVWILPVLFAITLHEAGHAYIAYHLGDSTAKQMGRLSFNPIKHLDLFGSVILPLLILVLSNFSFVFGYAKPVPINSANFKNPRRDIALATAAGPGANLIMAVFWSACFKIALMSHPQSSMLALFLLLSANAGILINLFLAFLNLIPIPPLDGSKILASFMSQQQALRYEKIEPYGFFILLLLMLTGLLDWILRPVMQGASSLIATVFNF